MRQSKVRQISGNIWPSNITTKELLCFFGILFKMVFRPSPGQPYKFCWRDVQWHPYTATMLLTRFRQIRTVLHFNDPRKSGNSNDALYKVRPLLNCLKITFPNYLELGNETALDEASVASRSSYGRDIIYYNPTKPTGKYHFRFYLLCCSDSFACIRIRIHTGNNSDAGDGFRPPDSPKTKRRRQRRKKGRWW